MPSARSRLATWFGDAAHVFIPLGEQFFIEAVREFRDELDDDMRHDAAAFIGQESVHRRAHEAVWGQRRENGVPIDTYVDLISRFRSLVEPHVSPKLRLAITAALEHHTAAFGRAFLEEDLEPLVGDEMAALLRWHGAEELEHRSVAFDVLAAVDDGLTLRLTGLALGSALLTTVPVVGMAVFAGEELRRRPIPVPRWPRPALIPFGVRLLTNIVREAAAYGSPAFRPGNTTLPRAYDDWLALRA